MQNYSLYYLIALKNYNPDSGYPFTHYLVGYLRGAGTKTWRSTGVVTVPSRKPVQMDERLGGQESVDDESSFSKQKRPSEIPPDISVDNISPELPPEDIYVIHMPRECGENLIDCLEDVQARDRAHEEVYLRELCDWLADALSREAGILTESERQVLILHYGLFGSPPHRYSEISALRPGCRFKLCTESYLATSQFRDTKNQELFSTERYTWKFVLSSCSLNKPRIFFRTGLVFMLL